MKILIIGNTKTVFASQLQGELVAKGLDVSLLDFEWLDFYDKNGMADESYAKEFDGYRKIPKLHMFFRMRLIAHIVKDFDVVNIHVARWYYSFIVGAFRSKKVIVSFYGSDFYRSGFFSKLLLKPLLRAAKYITFTNPATMEKFSSTFHCSKKNRLCRFGLKTLDFIDKNRNIEKTELKKELGYSPTKTIVTCGYNSTTAQQHSKTIEQIGQLPQDILDKTEFVFPLTYGDKANKEVVKKALERCNFKYKVLEDFLRGDTNANIKLASDVMINMLISDSFSGSMQEFLYAKNVVITGSWLPYETFEAEGVVFEKIDDVSDLAKKLQMVLDDLDRYKNMTDKNIEIISNLSSWKNNINSWIEVYEN